MAENPFWCARLCEVTVWVSRPGKRGPMLGEHTEEVLKEIGYTDEQIKAMEEKKAAVQIDTTQFKASG